MNKRMLTLLILLYSNTNLFGGLLGDFLDLTRGTPLTSPSTSYTPQGYTPPAKPATKPSSSPAQPGYQQPTMQYMVPQQQQYVPYYGPQQPLPNPQDQKNLDVILNMMGEVESFIDAQMRTLTLIPDFPQGVVVPEDLAAMSSDARKEYVAKFNQTNKTALDILKKAAYLKTSKDKKDPKKVIKTMSGEYQVEYEKLNKMKVTINKNGKTSQGKVKSSLMAMLKKVHAPYFATLQEVMGLNKKAMEALNAKLKEKPQAQEEEGDEEEGVEEE